MSEHGRGFVQYLEEGSAEPCAGMSIHTIIIVKLVWHKSTLKEGLEYAGTPIKLRAGSASMVVDVVLVHTFSREKKWAFERRSNPEIS